MTQAADSQRTIDGQPTQEGRSEARLLVVEDDPTIRLLICEVLQEDGFSIDQAKNGREALELFAPDRHQLVLTDVRMPELDGFALCAALRGSPQGEFLPVLMVTGLDDHDSVSRAYEVGATDFITKPINFPLLGRRIRYVLRASEAFRRVAASERRLAMAQRIAKLGQWEVQVGGDRLRVSSELCRILGLPQPLEDIQIGQLLEQVHREDQDLVRTWLASACSGASPEAVTYRILTRDAKIRWVRQLVESDRPAAHPLRTVTGTLQDITELREAEERIRQLSLIDNLTGLPNRNQLLARLKQAIALAKRHDLRFALLCMDLDNFKRVNDTLGHPTGDLLLSEAAKRLVSSVRMGNSTSAGKTRYLTEDMARIGGDEFAILLPEIADSNDASVVAKRLQEIVSRPMVLAKHEFVVTLSIGIALYPEDGSDSETLLKHADTAMYSAKQEGKNRYHFFDLALNAEALARLRMEEQLRRAITAGELSLHYQPQFDRAGGRVCGLEALLRWDSPSLGKQSPCVFIPLAEETGLIVPIGEWVLQTACSQMREWQQAGIGVPRIAVNISPVQFVQSGFAAMVSSVLAQTGLSAEALELEVTESLLMSNPDHAVRALATLKHIGVQLAIDDFGTGYSSLSRLKQFPIDRLKIDQSFVRDLPGHRDDAAIAIAVIAMADSMGLKVTAEGVENHEQARFLTDKGCDELQGYYLSRPMPAEQVIDVLRSHAPSTVDCESRLSLANRDALHQSMTDSSEHGS